MSYSTLQFIHVLGVVLLVGNVTVTSVWKVFADRTKAPEVIAYAQRLVTVTDWAFTGSGIALILIGGYGMIGVGGMDPFRLTWLLWSQVLFAASGLIWLGVLIPMQTRQARMARAFGLDGTIPDEYWRLNRRWLQWGIAATVPLVAAMWVMIVK